MKKKSILIIGNYPPPFGGVPRHIEYLAPYLVEKGWDVHILSGGNSGIEQKNGFTVYKIAKIEKYRSVMRSSLRLQLLGGLRLKSVMTSSFNHWKVYIANISIGREIIEKHGINIISAYNLSNGGPIGAVLSEEYNIPLVVTNFGEIYSKNNFIKKNLDVFKYVCKITMKLLAMSYHCAQSYKLLGLSPNVEVIPYGIDVKKFSPDNNGNKIRHKLSINTGDKVVLFVGRLIRDMGLHALMEVIPDVLQTNKKIKFIIIGQEGDLLIFALKLAQKFKENIFVIPNVPLEELPFYYAASTIVVVPTQGDRACGSLAAIEAMATCKPVIASKVGGIPEIVIDGETGILVPPENASALRKAILNLLNNELFIKKMGILGRKRVEKFFDEYKTDQKIEQIFERLVDTYK